MAGSEDLTGEDRRPFEPTYHHRTTSYQTLNGWVDPESYTETVLMVMREGSSLALDHLVTMHIMGEPVRSVRGRRRSRPQSLFRQFVQAHRPATSWTDLLGLWNERYPEYAYTQAANLQRDAARADRSRLGAPTKRAAVPRYSDPEADPMPILRRMQELGWWASLKTPFLESSESEIWWAGFTPRGTSGWNGRPDHEVGDVSLPLAVCKAAVLAVMSKQESAS